MFNAVKETNGNHDKPLPLIQEFQEMEDWKDTLEHQDDMNNFYECREAWIACRDKLKLVEIENDYLKKTVEIYRTMFADILMSIKTSALEELKETKQALVHKHTRLVIEQDWISRDVAQLLIDLNEERKKQDYDIPRWCMVCGGRTKEQCTC